MPFGTVVGLGPGHIVLDGNQLPPQQKKGTAPNFRPVSVVAKRSPIPATAEHLLHSSRQKVHILHSGRPFPQKIAPSHGPWVDLDRL